MYCMDRTLISTTKQNVDDVRITKNIVLIAVTNYYLSALAILVILSFVQIVWKIMKCVKHVMILCAMDVLKKRYI